MPPRLAPASCRTSFDPSASAAISRSSSAPRVSGSLSDDPAIRAAGIPVHVVAGAGHVMMLDNPVGFARAIADALDGLQA